MVIDSNEHKQFLLELFNQVTFPGQLLDLAYEVKQAIATAKLEEDRIHGTD